MEGQVVRGTRSRRKGWSSRIPSIQKEKKSFLTEIFLFKTINDTTNQILSVHYLHILFKINIMLSIIASTKVVIQKESQQKLFKRKKITIK